MVRRTLLIAIAATSAACSMFWARVLLEHGADPNIRSDQGLSVMEMAAAEGAPRELVALLLEKGFDPQKAARR